jgi:hypothetical protein
MLTTSKTYFQDNIHYVVEHVSALLGVLVLGASSGPVVISITLQPMNCDPPSYVLNFLLLAANS